MRYRYLIYDFDGTLFNSYPHMAASLVAAAADQGVTLQVRDIWLPIKRSVGDAVRFVCELHDLDPKQMARDYKRHEAPMTDKLAPFAGAAEACRAVRERGGGNYLYTHRDDSAYEYLKRHGMAEDFAGGVTSKNGFPHKPAPDAILYLLATHQLPPKETLMVGDRAIDVIAGHNAGIASCLLDSDGAAEACTPEYAFRDFQSFSQALITDA